MANNKYIGHKDGLIGQESKPDVCANCGRPEVEQFLVPAFKGEPEHWCLDCMRLSGKCILCACDIRKKVEDYDNYCHDECPDCLLPAGERAKDETAGAPEAFATICRILDLAAADGRLEDAVAELERYAQKRVDEIETELDEMARIKDYWYERCINAEEVIESSPCDPDLTPEQIEAHRLWNKSKKDLPQPPKQ